MHLTLRFALTLEMQGNLFESAEAVAGQQGAQAAQRLFLQLLAPLLAMGCVREEGGRRTVDVVSLRRFFLGVLGWSPRTLFEEASLDDLWAAWEGYAACHGVDGKKANAAFMSDMMRKLPDKNEDGR